MSSHDLKCYINVSYHELLQVRHDNVLPWIITWTEECFHNEASLKNCPVIESQLGFITGVVKHDTKNLKGLNSMLAFGGFCLPYKFGSSTMDVLTLRWRACDQIIVVQMGIVRICLWDFIFMIVTYFWCSQVWKICLRLVQFPMFCSASFEFEWLSSRKWDCYMSCPKLHIGVYI